MTRRDQRTGVFTSGIVSIGQGVDPERFRGTCYVLEMLGEVYRYDAEAHEGGLTAGERLKFHQEHSQPLMDKLHAWLEAQFAERKVEPNSGLARQSPTCCGTGKP